jgi:hypothetical protein
MQSLLEVEMKLISNVPRFEKFASAEAKSSKFHNIAGHENLSFSTFWKRPAGAFLGRLPKHSTILRFER